MNLITISGLDGSGKSTQIQLLKSYLESQGKRVYYFHAVEFSLANKLTGKKSSQGKSVTKANLFQIFLRKIFLKVDILRFGLLRSKLRNSGCDYILSDRYFYDSVINIQHLEASSIDATNRVSAKIPTPDLAVYLQASPEIIMQRERVPDQGLEYLEKKEKLYDEFAKSHDLKIIDGNRDKETIFQEILALL